MFFVLKDFSVSVNLSVKMSSDELCSGPQLIIKSKFDGLELRFNPSTYDKLLNIGKVLALEARVAQMLKSDKKRIIDLSRKVGTLNCFSGGVWKKLYAILSGAYLYFYETNKQSQPTAYYYLDNAAVKKNKCHAEDKLHTIALNNCSEVLLVGSETEKQCDEWTSVLIEHVASLSLPRVEAPEQPAESTVSSTGNMRE